MGKGKNIAYVRVSTIEQNEARQKEALEPYQIDKWFIEKASGKDTKRPKLQEMLEYISVCCIIKIPFLQKGLAKNTYMHH